MSFYKGSICFECGSKQNIHNHHVVPKSLGGMNTIPLCVICHGKVHDKDLLKMHNLSKIARNKIGFKTGRPKNISHTDFETKEKLKHKLLKYELVSKSIKDKLEKIKKQEELIKICFSDKTFSVKETCKKLKISRATYYRKIKKLDEENVVDSVLI